MKIYYTLFAENPQQELSTGVSQSIDQNGAYYSLYAFDNSGLVSDEITVKVVYVLKNYALYGAYGNDYSLPVTDKCIVRPIQVPRNLQIANEFTTHNTLKITWEPVEGVTKYGVYVKNLETGVAWKIDVDQNSHILANLKPDNSYEIQVASHVQYDFYSELSAPVIGTTLLSYFSAVSVEPTINSIRLSWQSVPGAAHYRVYYGVPGEFIGASYSVFAIDTAGQVSEPASLEWHESRAWDIFANSETGIATFTAIDLSADTQYLFYLVAYDVSNKTLTAQSVYASTLAIAPAMPDIFSYVIKEITAHSVTLAWNTAARAKFYRIHLNNNPEPHIDYIFYPEIKVTGLLADTIYTITVVSVNSGGEVSANPFAIRTAKGQNAIRPSAPRLIYPNCSQITDSADPSLYWQSTSALTQNSEFIVAVANSQDFSRPLWQFNSERNKAGFSFKSPPDNHGQQTHQYRLQKKVVTNNSDN